MSRLFVYITFFVLISTSIGEDTKDKSEDEHHMEDGEKHPDGVEMHMEHSEDMKKNDDEPDTMDHPPLKIKGASAESTVEFQAIINNKTLTKSEKGEAIEEWFAALPSTEQSAAKEDFEAFKRAHGHHFTFGNSTMDIAMNIPPSTMMKPPAAASSTSFHMFIVFMLSLLYI